jgi:hypothetical protein
MVGIGGFTGLFASRLPNARTVGRRGMPVPHITDLDTLIIPI